MNPEFKDLADDIYRRRVLRARGMSMEERLSESLQLMEETRPMIRAGIQALNPDANEEEVRAIFKKRLRALRRVSDAGLFHPMPANQ
jgi:hypothetical protein